MINATGKQSRSEERFQYLVKRAGEVEGLLREEKLLELNALACSQGFAFALRKLTKHVLDSMLPKIRKAMSGQETWPMRVRSPYEFATNHGLKVTRHGYHLRANAALIAWEEIVTNSLNQTAVR